MSSEITATIISGIFLLISTAASIITTFTTRNASKETRRLYKTLDKTTKILYVEGDTDSHEALLRMTLNEDYRINVTRFGPKSIQRQKRYFQAIKSKLVGSEFEDNKIKKIEKYNRLMYLGSQENKDSLFSMINEYLQSGCDNVVIRITLNKNDFELLISEKEKKAALCFHDLNKQDVVYSCIIHNDFNIFSKFDQLYQNLWNEDIILEIDFSRGIDHVKQQLSILEKIEPIGKTDHLSQLDRIILESEKKIAACKAMKNINTV